MLDGFGSYLDRNVKQQLLWLQKNKFNKLKIILENSWGLDGVTEAQQ